MALLKSIATVSVWTMASRVLGLVRDILIARYLGAGFVADAFFVAFKFPNFFRHLFAEGAFSVAFVPQFAAILEREGRDAARAFAQAALAVLICVLLPATIAAQIAMPQIMLGLAPGFKADPATFQLAVDLTRLTFPYILFMAITALFGGVMNSLGRFAAAAAAPVLLNIVLIAALIFLRLAMETAGHALAWGVLAAGAAQFLLLAVALARAGMALSLPRPRLNPRVKKLMRLMVPGAIGAGVVQINLVVATILASLLPAGSVSYLYYADRLAQLPLGVIGVAVGVALLPLMSRQLSAGDTSAAQASQNRSIEIALLLTVPAAVALIVIPQPIIAVLFERGSFDAASTAATGRALVAFSLGLPAYVLIKALAPGFFARADTKTPVKIAAVAMAVNVIAAVILMQYLAHAGIALGAALSAWVNAGLLWFGLRRRGYFTTDARLRRRVPRIVAAALVMGGCVYYAHARLAIWFDAGFWQQLLALTVLVVGGFVLYVALLLAMRVTTPSELRRTLIR
ncbi:MAG: murein biosynthesis integral membrane protein MurJ [Alphaproteobacteria bacterium]|nr:murein biosynthesis integral membrane protein MurJ [Alphaproteobacteria bacterium]